MADIVEPRLGAPLVAVELLLLRVSRPARRGVNRYSGSSRDIVGKRRVRQVRCGLAAAPAGRAEISAGIAA